jgi:hypothetical protein
LRGKTICLVIYLNLLSRVRLVNKMFVPFKPAFIINFESNAKPTFVNDWQLIISLSVSSNTPLISIGLSISRIQFTLCVQRSFMVQRILKRHVVTRLL